MRKFFLCNITFIFFILFLSWIIWHAYNVTIKPIDINKLPIITAQKCIVSIQKRSESEVSINNNDSRLQCPNVYRKLGDNNQASTLNSNTPRDKAISQSKKSDITTEDVRISGNSNNITDTVSSIQSSNITTSHGNEKTLQTEILQILEEKQKYQKKQEIIKEKKEMSQHDSSWPSEKQQPASSHHESNIFELLNP